MARKDTSAMWSPAPRWMARSTAVKPRRPTVMAWGTTATKSPGTSADMAGSSPSAFVDWPPSATGATLEGAQHSREATPPHGHGVGYESEEVAGHQRRHGPQQHLDLRRLGGVDDSGLERRGVGAELDRVVGGVARRDQLGETGNQL